MGGGGLSLLGRDKHHWREAHHLFFPYMGKAQALCLLLLTLGPSEVWMAWTGVSQGKSGVGGTVKKLGERLWDFQNPAIHGLHSSHLS